MTNYKFATFRSLNLATLLRDNGHLRIMCVRVNFQVSCIFKRVKGYLYI